MRRQCSSLHVCLRKRVSNGGHEEQLNGNWNAYCVSVLVSRESGILVPAEGVPVSSNLKNVRRFSNPGRASRHRSRLSDLSIPPDYGGFFAMRV